MAEQSFMTLSQRLGEEDEFYRILIESAMTRMRNAAPGIIQSFDASAQTVTVQIAIREKIILNGVSEWRAIPVLVDVPIVVPRAGGYLLTLPVAPGDECLVIFGDTCMDAWWQSGGVQNQVDRRRHDLSDGFAIIGVWSQPKIVSGYSTDSIQLRDEAGTSYVEVKSGTINIVGANEVITNCKSATITATDEVEVTAPTVTVNASTECIINSDQVALSGPWSGLKPLIDERLIALYNGHVHHIGNANTEAPDTLNLLSVLNCVTTKVKGE